MNGRDLIQKILNTKVYGYEADVIIRTPDYRAYRDCNIHVANGQNGQIIMIDLIDEEQILPGNDYDLDKTINSTPPVEDEDKLDILSECYAFNAKINVLKYDIEHYPLIYNVLKQIIAISKEGAISYNLVVPMKKEVDEDYEAGFYYVEDEICGIIRWHFDKLGYKIDEKVKDNYNEFFMTW